MSIKSGPAVPGWAVGVVIGVVVLAALFFGFKAMSGEGPRDPSTYPKEAYQPPKYDPSQYGGYTQDGKPVGPRPH